MKRRPLFWKLYPSFVFIALASLIAVTIIACLSFRSFHYQQRERDLKVRATLFKKNFLFPLQTSNTAEFQKQVMKLSKGSETRFTIILPTGQVIGDSTRDPFKMDNHKSRPEVEEALRNGKGMAIRYSHTLKKYLMYYAISIKEKKTVVAAIRAAIPLSDIQEALLGIYYKIAIGFFFLLLLIAISSWWVSKSISDPLARMKAYAKRLANGDFSSKVQIDSSYPQELFELGQAINEISIQLNQKIETITNQSNEQEAVFSSMIEGVIAVDKDGRIIKLNQAACEILEISINAHGKSIQESIRNSKLQAIILSSLNKNMPISQEVYIPKEDGLYIYVRSGPLLDNKKEKCGIVVVINDITKLKELEGHRKEFVANVSHELRTPLTNIQGYAETLLNPSLKNPEERLEFIKIINNHASRLGTIIEDLLTLSNIEKETGKNDIELKEGELKPLIESAITFCQKKALKRKIKIALTCPSSLKVKLNSPLIEQAIINLLDNAIKYGNKNSKIEISAVIEENSVIIIVKDQGMGIPKENLPRLFERFYRVDKARSRKIGGTGLGLSIVKHIVLAHGGRVEVQSEINQGSIFFIHLPT